MSGERTKLSDSEKITINLGYVDLGRIDLLVRDGFYSNRSDVIRTAVRNHLAHYDEEIRKSIVRRKLHLGLRTVTRDELQTAVEARTPLDIYVLGLAVISDDVTPELARAAISSIQVLGALQASPAVRQALAGRLI